MRVWTASAFGIYLDFSSIEPLLNFIDSLLNGFFDHTTLLFFWALKENHLIGFCNFTQEHHIANLFFRYKPDAIAIFTQGACIWAQKEI